MHLQIIRQEQEPHKVDLLTSSTGRILFKEGLGFPYTRYVLAFRSLLSCLAVPISLLARSIMRQPSWTLQPGQGIDVPLGNVYIFVIQKILVCRR